MEKVLPKTIQSTINKYLTKKNIYIIQRVCTGDYGIDYQIYDPILIAANSEDNLCNYIKGNVELVYDVIKSIGSMDEEELNEEGKKIRDILDNGDGKKEYEELDEEEEKKYKPIFIERIKKSISEYKTEEVLNIFTQKDDIFEICIQGRSVDTILNL